ncbi:hydroxycarboxylic acid receptor 2-like [Narcine bancroftii]|uniref:hydroxycarboxylic acid receptor 2-like n=1 Tax=Narcine bancroftii TaxID=1343680 RepID=UPI0038320E88
MDNDIQQCTPAKDIYSSYNPPVLILTFIFGFIGNATALWIFCFHVKSWRPNTVYSLSLAVADTLLICCLPFRADYYRRGKDWIFGDALCRLKIFLIYLNRAESVVFLTVMALHRYFKVIYPHHKVSKMTTKCAVKVTCFLWLATLAVCLHFLMEPRTFLHNNVTKCEPLKITRPLDFSALWTMIILIVFKFILPATIILFSTCGIAWKLKQVKSEMRAKYKPAVRLVIAVVVVFLICFLPTNVAAVAVLISSTFKDCKHFDVTVQLFQDTLCITYLNSVLDPVVYYFSSSTFKDTLRRSLISHPLRYFRPGTTHSVQPTPVIQQVSEPQRSSVCNTFDHFKIESSGHL